MDGKVRPMRRRWEGQRGWIWAGMARAEDWLLLARLRSTCPRAPAPALLNGRLHELLICHWLHRKSAFLGNTSLLAAFHASVRLSALLPLPLPAVRPLPHPLSARLGLV